MIHQCDDTLAADKMLCKIHRAQSKSTLPSIGKSHAMNSKTIRLKWCNTDRLRTNVEKNIHTYYAY